jgi:hypothetical protein
MTFELVEKQLILTLPLEKSVPSRSGKTLVIASTHGTVTTDVLYRGKHVVITFNAFIYRREKAYQGRARASRQRAKMRELEESRRLTTAKKETKKPPRKGPHKPAPKVENPSAA